MILLKVFVLFFFFFLICQTEIERLCLLLITDTSGADAGHWVLLWVHCFTFMMRQPQSQETYVNDLNNLSQQLYEVDLIKITIFSKWVAQESMYFTW